MAVDGRVRVETARFGRVEDASEWVRSRDPRLVVVGLSLIQWVSFPCEVRGGGSKQTYAATPVFADVVRRGELLHDGGEDAQAQTRVAEVIRSESGLLLSGRKSRGPVDVLKAAAWAVDEALRPVQVPAPAIY